MAQVERQRPTPRHPIPKKPVGKPVASNKPKASPRPAGQGGFFGKSPLALVEFGPPGVGKTDFAGHFPNAGFVIDPQEDGILDLVEFGKTPEPVFIEEVDNFLALLDLCEQIATRDCETVVFDSLTGFEKICFQHHCRENFDDDWSVKGFYSFQQGPKNAAKTDWPRFLDALEIIRANGKNVILIAHAQVKTFNNPEGADYDRFTPYLDKETWQQTHRWAKAVLFYNYHVEIEKKGPRAKADPDSERRFLYTEWSPAYDAKNRYGLDPLIDAGRSGEDAFQAFATAFKKAAKV